MWGASAIFWVIPMLYGWSTRLVWYSSGRLPYIDLGGASKRLLRLLGLLYFTTTGQYNMTTNLVVDVTFELGIILPTHIIIITRVLPKKRWSAKLVDRFICVSVFLGKQHFCHQRRSIHTWTKADRHPVIDKEAIVSIFGWIKTPLWGICRSSR